MENDRTLDAKHFGLLIAACRELGYETYGPTLRDGAIVLDSIESLDSLPTGWTDEQEAGHYRTVRNGSSSLFQFAVGPDSWKKLIFPPNAIVWRARADEKTFETNCEPARIALLGVRACDLKGLLHLDRVFMNGNYSDPHYTAIRKNLLIIAVNCTNPSGTCFCASMETGPEVKNGFDIVLTEVVNPLRHYFLVRSGSDKGEKLLRLLPTSSAGIDEKEEAAGTIANAVRQMGRTLQLKGVKELLARNIESPQWDEIAQRCLSCGNCTMVCPTCFCHAVEDQADLATGDAIRQRKWDSCFSLDFSYIHGGVVRVSLKSRYRQWLMHKMSYWFDQFGSAGCVGCGRCITWCPAAIDITAEIGAMRQRETDVQASEVEHANKNN